MQHPYRGFSSTNPNLNNGNHWENTDSGTGAWTETTSQESLPGQDRSLNILPFRSRLVTPEQLRIFTYVLLGMTLGVITVALFIDFHVSRGNVSRETVQQSAVSRETAGEVQKDESVK